MPEYLKIRKNFMYLRLGKKNGEMEKKREI